MQNGIAALRGKVFGALARALKRWPRTDGIDPHVWREALCGGLGKGPQTHFGDRIGHEFRCQLANALIDHIDHQSPRQWFILVIIQRLWRMRGQRLCQNERCAQIAFHMTVPTFACGIGNIVIFKN